MQIQALSTFLASYGIVASQATNLYRNLRSEDASTMSVLSKVAAYFEWVALDSFSASMSMSMLNVENDSWAFVGPSDNSAMAASTKSVKSSVGSGKAAKTGSTKSSKSSSQPSSQPSEILKPSLSSRPSGFCDNPTAIAVGSSCPTGSPSICCQESSPGTPSPVPIVCRPPTGTGEGPEACQSCIQPCPTPAFCPSAPSAGVADPYKCDATEDCCEEGAICTLTLGHIGNNQRCCKQPCTSPSSCPPSNVPTQYSCDYDNQCCNKNCNNGRCL